MKGLQRNHGKCTTKRNDTWRYIWVTFGGENDGRVAAKMIRVGTFALREVAQWCAGSKKGREKG